MRNVTGRNGKGRFWTCQRKRKSKCEKDPIEIQKIIGTIIQRLGAWSVWNPFGKNVHLDMGPKHWISKLLHGPQGKWGAQPWKMLPSTRTVCDRVQCATGAVWKLPCGHAHEICSLLYQPHGSERQAVHKDGHARYAKPDNANDFSYNYFLNIIVPMHGDIPTLFRGPKRLLGACAPCENNEIRIFNGGVWHAGDANNSGKWVWKLLLG